MSADTPAAPASLASRIPAETAVSCLINALISAAIFLAAFRGAEIVVLGQQGGFAIDFLPQALFVGLFAALPPMLIMSGRIRSGKVAGRMLAWPAILLRSVLMGMLSLAAFGGGAFVLTRMLEGRQLSFGAALSVKVVFGVLVSAIITPIALGMLKLPREHVSRAG